jgi:hypothetical protein
MVNRSLRRWLERALFGGAEQRLRHVRWFCSHCYSYCLKFESIASNNQFSTMLDLKSKTYSIHGRDLLAIKPSRLGWAMAGDGERDSRRS